MKKQLSFTLPFAFLLALCTTGISYADCSPSAARVSFRENRTVPLVGNVVHRITYTVALPADCDARPSGGWLGQFQLFSETARASRFNISRQDNSSAFHNFRDRIYLGENNVNILRDGNFWGENDTRHSDVHVLKDGKYTLVAPIIYNIGNARYEKTFSYKFTVGEVAKPTPKPTPKKPTPTPTPKNTDKAAPSVEVTGLPTTDAEKSNVKGTLNIAINISDDKALQSVSVIGFNTTFIKQSNLNRSTYSNSFILDTALYPDGQYTFTVTATDTSRKVKTYNEILRLTNHGSAPQPVTPTPAPSTPTPTPNPDNGSDGGTDIGALMNLLVQLLSQLMQVISNLDLNTEKSVAITRSLEATDAAEMGLIFAELIKTNKQQLREIKQTRRIPKIAKRFAKSYKKALKAKSEKRKAKFARKADRQLNRILKNLQ